MESLRKQAAKLLGEQKKYKRWLAVFLCLALLVTSGTVAALKLNGQAQNYEKEVLECTLEVHEHTAECYEGGILYAGGDVSGGDAAGPACGYADYVVHVHNDNCRDKEGELVCQLPEIEPHVHDEGCYQEQRILVCGLEETEVHVHAEECRHLICGLGEAAEGEETEGTENPEGTEETPEGAGEAQNADVAENADNAENAGEAENGDDAEKAESHVHTEECRNMICGQEESLGHVHSDECRILTCEQEENQGHVHSDACSALICEQEESQGHVHTEACVSRVQGDLTCANTEEDHQHTDECYAWTEENICGQEEGEGAHAHTEDCYDAHACGQEEGEGSHAHTEECYDAHGCGLEEGEGSHVHTDECYDGYSCGLEEGAVENDENGGTVDTADAGESAETTDPADSEDPADTEEPHVHTDECYDGYVCGLEQGGLADPENGHVHGEECYAVLMVPSCGQLELHTHAEGCYDEAGSLVCGIPELKEHVHGKECIKVVELTKEEIEAIQAAEKGSSEGSGTAKTEHALYEKVYDDGSIRVTAQYDETANIPADAEMYVEIVAKSEDEAEVGEESEEGTDPAEGNEGSEGSDAAEGEGTVAGNEEGTDAGSDSEDAADKEETDKDNEAVNDETASDAETDDAESGTDESGEGANTDDAETDDEQPGSDAEPSEEAEPIETTSEDVATPSGENDADAQPETETDADEADLDSQPEETVSESGEQDADAPAGSDDNAVPEDEEGDAISAEIEEKILQGKGRMEIVEEEVTYRIVFRLNGEEIEPEGSVTFTICDLENEESQPEEKTFTPGAGLEQMMFSLTRMVEVFVQTEFQKTYEDESIRVIAEYNKSANIPEEAELRVYEITPESDPERFADCEEKFKEAVEDENAEMSTLLEIGFYVDDEEIEPEDTVTMMVQFLDGEGQPIGDPINVVHFAAEGKTEVLEDSGTDEEGYITFKTESFSPFAFFRLAGATLGIGRSYHWGIPVYVSKDGEWIPIAGIEDFDAISDIDSGAAGVRIGTFCEEVGGTLYDYAQCNVLRDSITSNNGIALEKWIGYSTSDEVGKGITTAECKNATYYELEYTSAGLANVQKSGAAWMFGTKSYGEVKAIYFLPNNTKTYDNADIPASMFSNNGYKVIFNPGNGNQDRGATLKTSYGLISPVEVVVPEESVDEYGYADIKLPKNEDLGITDGFNFNPKPEEQPWQYRIEKENESNYNHKLIGWYNVIDETYYSVDANGEIVVKIKVADVQEGSNGQKTLVEREYAPIFYGDWIAESYNVPSDVKNKINAENAEGGIAEDISEFVTTRVYDYNELFNVYSASYNESSEWTSRAGFYADNNWGTLKVADGHILNLASTGQSKFPFIQTIGTKPNDYSVNNLIAPRDWQIGTVSANDRGVQNLLGAAGKGSVLLDYLFPEPQAADNIMGVHFVGYGNYLYQLYGADDTHTGYYEYNSVNNAALYDQEDQRFYICPYRQWIYRNGSGYYTSFLPFNYKGSQMQAGITEVNTWADNAQGSHPLAVSKDGDVVLNEDSAYVNYHFGMCTEVQFYLPAKPGDYILENGEKKWCNLIDGEGDDPQNMVFEFSGDDDVWVFVDDTLVLDLGGTHGKLTGTIDFSEGVVKDNIYDNGGQKKGEPIVNSGKTAALQTIEAGNHKLTIYYLERGAGLSNCHIKFNIVPWYKIIPPTANTVTVEKEWDDAGRTDITAGTDTHKDAKVYVDLYQYAKGADKNDISQGTLIRENVLLTYNEETKKLSYTWEALSPDFDYVVRERKMDNYVSTSKYSVSDAYRYWAESDTFMGEKAESDEIVILSRIPAGSGETGAREAEEHVMALNSDLGVVDVTTSHGVIQSELPESVKWIAKRYGDGYSLQNKSTGKYLNITEDGLSLSENSQAAFSISLDAKVRLTTGSLRVIYKEGRFLGDTNVGATGSENETVRVFRDHEVSSRVKNYVITNTFLPEITIQKVDSENPEKMLSGAKFTLARTRDEKVNEEGGDNETVSGTRTIYWWGYYDHANRKWVDSEGKSSEEALKMAQSAAADASKEFTLDESLSLEQLLDGKYILIEREAPKGYISLKEEERKIEFTVSGGKITAVTSGQISKTDESGKTTTIAIAEVKPKTDDKTLIVRNEAEPVRTTRIRLAKVSTGPKEEALEGAVFNLYRELKDETEKNEAESKGEQIETLKVDGAEKDVVLVEKDMKSVAGTGLFFDGNLKSGIYYLQEIDPPAGYKKLSDVVTITVDVKATGTSVNVSMTTGGAAIGKVDPGRDEQGEYKMIKIYNTQGYELPETGSMGTKPFTIGGAMLIISAAAILMYGYSVRRRKSERRLNK